MPDDYEKYEKECAKIRKDNAELIDAFADWLQAKGLSEKTVDTHCRNMDFYLNHFLLYEDAIEAASGMDEVGMFLGDWFIRKAMWSSPSAIKSNAASLKKFYTFMAEKGYIEKEDLDELKEDIREGMPEWLGRMTRYDDPNVDFEDVWEF